MCTWLRLCRLLKVYSTWEERSVQLYDQNCCFHLCHIVALYNINQQNAHTPLVYTSECPDKTAFLRLVYLWRFSSLCFFSTFQSNNFQQKHMRFQVEAVIFWSHAPSLCTLLRSAKKKITLLSCKNLYMYTSTSILFVTVLEQHS